jgi:uncharacterized membrane protein YdbT with pleckstrin-like domain
MSEHVHEASRWIYQGVWAVLVRWLRVSDAPPQLPAAEGEQVDTFQPAPGFLGYLKFQFWFWAVFISMFVFVPWLILAIAVPIVGLLLALPAALFVVLLNAVSYVALHLRFDTTWYIISERSLRIRRGIWVIHETTITYDNIQNIRVSQGPLQRYLGCTDLVVETAGGGQNPQTAGMGLNHGLIEGVENAHQIRDLISSRLRQSTTAGLGDDEEDEPVHAMHTPAMSRQHIALLKQIRDAARQLEAGRGVG